MTFNKFVGIAVIFVGWIYFLNAITYLSKRNNTKYNLTLLDEKTKKFPRGVSPDKVHGNILVIPTLVVFLSIVAPTIISYNAANVGIIFVAGGFVS